MKFNNLEVIQSYVLTTAKYDFSIDEKRIMYFLILLAQSDLKGKKLINNYVIGENLFKDKIIRLYTRDLLVNDKSKNHYRIKKALTSLMTKVIEYEDDEIWTAFSIIQSPIINKGSEILEFSVNPIMWNAILKISAKGFSKYELKTAMSFDSVYAMRFYELFSNNLRPQTITIDELKKRFKIEDKYKNKPTNFIKYVVEKAKKELDAKAPYSFDFKPLKTGRKITAIRFIPYSIPENQNIELENKKLQRKTSIHFDLSLKISRYLKRKFDFDDKGLRANADLLRKANLSFDLLGWLSELRVDPYKVENKPGYVINALRNYLENLEKKKREEEEASRINNLTRIVSNQKKYK
jgi:plasmid replication initiation protein